jgi:hypothetical protein
MTRRKRGNGSNEFSPLNIPLPLHTLSQMSQAVYEQSCCFSLDILELSLSHPARKTSRGVEINYFSFIPMFSIVNGF